MSVVWVLAAVLLSVVVVAASDASIAFAGSDAWRRFCRSNHLEPSMSRKGNCWDNAVAESFFSSLKKERIKKPSEPRNLGGDASKVSIALALNVRA